MWLIEQRDALTGPPPGLSTVDLIWTDTPVTETREQRQALLDAWWGDSWSGVLIALGPSDRSERTHEQIRHDIERASEPGDLVADPYCGTGTTGLVAIQLGRNFYGCDTDPDMVRRARARLSTGEDPG